MARWNSVRRALVPTFIVRIYYLIRHGAVISARSEVDLVGSTHWGRGCVISAFTKIKIFGPFTMGRRVQIGSNTFIGAGPGGLTIGDDVLISPNCTILTTSYRYDQIGVPLQQQDLSSQGVRIGHRVWVGANSVIIDGSDIGDDVIVAAGSVVSGRIPERSIIQGNPARVVFTRRATG
ncbi:MAG TPA: acyltransferase [Gemmatimonadales bacterium]|jgi:acetyltransferase-like isoleucine patch superfamily enzyme